jgi:O-antigen biosynthesis protein
MRTGSRVVPALFIAASAVAVVATAIFARTSMLAVAGSCALGLILVQGWRQNRSVMARLARMQRRAAQQRPPADASAASTGVAATEIHDDLRRIRLDQLQIARRPTSGQEQASMMISRLDRIQDQTDVTAAHVKTLSDSVNALIGRPAELRSFQGQPHSHDTADHAMSGALTLDTLVPGEHTFRNLPLTPGRASVVLVVDDLDPHRMGTNVKTALTAGLSAAEKLQRPLRVVPLTLATPREEVTAQLRTWVTEATESTFQAGDVSITPADAVTEEPFDPTDAWIVTSWRTAHALSAACRNGTISPKQVIYLIQDYEPGSLAWGSDHALAAETYRQGFHALVHSHPLGEALARQTGTPVDAENVFGPDLDTTRLRDAAHAWKPGQPGEVRVLFDSRPSDARTMFSLGIAALQQWVESLQDSGVQPVIYSAGEPHAPVDLGNGHVVESLGHLSPDTYYDLLSRVDIGLGLMHGPHPGQFALELPMAGIPTVTNTFESFRTAWVDGLVLATATPSGIATAMEETLRRSQALTAHTPASPVGELGRPLEEALHSVMEGLAW